MSRETDLAWAAGFVDGEGCFHTGLSQDLRYSLRFSLTQVEREPLTRLHQILGFGNLNGPYKPQGSQRKPISRYTAHGSAVRQLAGLLWPYLSKPKKRQFLEAYHRFKNGDIDKI